MTKTQFLSRVSIVALMALAGCASENYTHRLLDPAMERPQPRNMVAFEEIRHEVKFAKRAEAASVPELEKLYAHLVELSSEPGDRFYVQVEDPTQPLQARRAGALITHLGRMGIVAHRIRGRRADEADPDRVSVVLHRIKLTTAECSTVPRVMSGQAMDRHGPAGCANHANLAAMLADPRDLVQPRDLTPAEAAHAMKSISEYRGEGQKTGNSGEAMKEMFAKAFGGGENK